MGSSSATALPLAEAIGRPQLMGLPQAVAHQAIRVAASNVFAIGHRGSYQTMGSTQAMGPLEALSSQESMGSPRTSWRSQAARTSNLMASSLVASRPCLGRCYTPAFLLANHGWARNHPMALWAAAAPLVGKRA